MKTGDFAEKCGVPISVLRFYDTEGVLKPVYTDTFTGYRYYAESQIALCTRIGVLKVCGFTLAQIKKLLESDKKYDILNMLLCLNETQKNIMENINNNAVPLPH